MRAKRKSDYAAFYKRLGFESRVWLDDFGEVQACYYCGEPADTIDHAYPLSALVNHLDSGLPLPGSLWVVPACRECNSLLGNQVFETMRKRRGFIKKALVKRYRRYLRQPVWAPEEVELLGYALKGVIRQGQLEHSRLMRRLGYKHLERQAEAWTPAPAVVVAPAPVERAPAPAVLEPPEPPPTEKRRPPSTDPGLSASLRILSRERHVVLAVARRSGRLPLWLIQQESWMLTTLIKRLEHAELGKPITASGPRKFSDVQLAAYLRAQILRLQNEGSHRLSEQLLEAGRAMRLIL